MAAIVPAVCGAAPIVIVFDVRGIAIIALHGSSPASKVIVFDTTIGPGGRGEDHKGHETERALHWHEILWLKNIPAALEGAAGRPVNYIELRTEIEQRRFNLSASTGAVRPEATLACSSV